jgi:hypothetical protein
MKNIYNRSYYRFRRWFRELLKKFPFSIIGKHLKWLKYSTCSICARSDKYNYFIVPDRVWNYFSLNTVNRMNAGVVCYRCFSEFCDYNGLPYSFALTPYYNTYPAMYNFERGRLDKWRSIIESESKEYENQVYSQVYGTPEDWKLEEWINENKKID